jgi:hypothetical protein
MNLQDFRKLNDAYDRLEEAKKLVTEVVKRTKLSTDQEMLAVCLEHIELAQEPIA